MNFFERFLVVLLGLCLGSFANVCIYRIPLGQSILRPGSHCPHCKNTLHWWHNIPLLSFLLLRARCAFCGQPVSWRYPLGEAGFAALFALTIFSWGTYPAMSYAGGIFLLFLWVISFIDLKHKIIPNPLSVGLLLIGLVFSPWNNLLGASVAARIVQSVGGAFFGFVLMFALAWAGEKIFGREALGGGDIKLMAGVGVFLGWRGVWETLFLASVVGTVWALVLIILKKAGRGSYLPFGPFLALGAWIIWILGTKAIYGISSIFLGVY